MWRLSNAFTSAFKELDPIPQFRGSAKLDRFLDAESDGVNHIRKLSLFGSVLTPRFRAGSDIDVLVEFDPGHTPGLLTLAGMEIEISERLGRKVELRTAEDLSRYFRDEVVASALPQFERTGEGR
jgi:predicted nucleotidyltransferase